jgi:hypothetical protein
MGTKTPNMSIYKPSSGQELYNASYQAGMDNIDTHDHSGAPNNGVQIGTSGIQDGAITPEKLSEQILQQATVTTTNATPTEIVSIPVDESSAVTITGRYITLRSDATECAGGQFMGVFHRPTGGSVTLVPATLTDANDNSSGTPALTLVADVPNEAVSIRCTGEAAKTFDWKVVYNVLAQP